MDEEVPRIVQITDALSVFQSVAREAIGDFGRMLIADIKTVLKTVVFTA